MPKGILNPWTRREMKPYFAVSFILNKEDAAFDSLTPAQLGLLREDLERYEPPAWDASNRLLRSAALEKVQRLVSRVRPIPVSN